MIFGIVEGFKNFIRSKFTGFISVLSMIFALTLISLIMLIFYNIRINLRIFENKTTIQVYFPTEYSTEQSKSIEAKISQYPEVKTSVFISKDDGLKQFLSAQDLSEDDVRSMLKANPLPDMIDLEIASSNLSKEQILYFKEKLLSLDSRLDIKIKLSFFENVKKVAKRIFQILIAITIFVMTITVILIFNTIRLSIHSKKLSIMTMKLVGAKNFLIRIPFIFESLYQAIIACVIVLFGTFYFVQFINQNTDLTEYLYRPLILYKYHMYIIVLLSIVITSLGAFLSVRKYLKLKFRT